MPAVWRMPGREVVGRGGQAPYPREAPTHAPWLLGAKDTLGTLWQLALAWGDSCPRFVSCMLCPAAALGTTGWVLPQGGAHGSPTARAGGRLGNTRVLQG